MTMYIVVVKDKVAGVYKSFNEALRRVAEIGEGSIYRGIKIMDLSKEEASELASLLTEKLEPVEAPTTPRPKAVVVLDQMFKGYFAPVIARSIPDIEVYEIVGKGLEEPVRVGNIVKHPAQDDFDVISLLELLAEKRGLVIFFTGDKKLAAQATLVKNVKTLYAPPSEFPGKESLAKFMIEEIKRAVGRG